MVVASAMVMSIHPELFVAKAADNPIIIHRIINTKDVPTQEGFHKIIFIL